MRLTPQEAKLPKVFWYTSGIPCASSLWLCSHQSNILFLARRFLSVHIERSQQRCHTPSFKFSNVATNGGRKYYP